MRFNDGKVSPSGTLLVGRMHSKWRDGNPGRLYRLDPGSRCASPVFLFYFFSIHSYIQSSNVRGGNMTHLQLPPVLVLRASRDASWRPDSQLSIQAVNEPVGGRSGTRPLISWTPSAVSSWR